MTWHDNNTGESPRGNVDPRELQVELTERDLWGYSGMHENLQLTQAYGRAHHKSAPPRSPSTTFDVTSAVS